MSGKKYPMLNRTEQIQAVAKCTGYSEELIGYILQTYGKIIRETLLSGVEATFFDFGKFTFKELKPRDFELRGDTKYHKKGDVVRVKGYRYPVFKVQTQYKQEMRETTGWDYDDYQEEEMLDNGC